MQQYVLLSNDSQYKKYNNTTSSWEVVTATDPLEADYLNGNTLSEISLIPESAWKELAGVVEVHYYTDDTSITEAQFSVETEPFTLADELGESFSVIEYTDNPTQDSSVIQTETEPFSVYDYISETPEVLVYTELNDDIKVETTTEPFDIYDEFGEEVEVLYYTDDPSVTSPNLSIEANWSPIDELEGDFEIVTWTDEVAENVTRTLEMTSIPKPQIVKLISKKNIYGYLKDIVIPQSSKSLKGKEYVRFLISHDDETYYTWDKKDSQFKIVDILNEQNILNLGMTSSDLDLLTENQWNDWSHEFINICVFLKDNERDTMISTVDSLSYSTFSPKDTNYISSSSLYILNTTAKINIELIGNRLTGFVNDDDLTRVQYRILLNNRNYYPGDGSFTDLSPSPQNIDLEIPTRDMIIGGINTLKVEFQDFFGTTDYWLTQFVGEYSGVMFADDQNKYYSTDSGEFLRSLDFGTIIAGQTSQAKVVYVQNKHSFDIQNILLSKLSGTLPEGAELQISKTDHPFEPKESIVFDDLLKFGDKLAFYVRLTTAKSTSPGFGEFDITVKADPVK